MADAHAPGDVVADKYRITDVLGRGGMGVTYEAEDLQRGGKVAIKQLKLWHQHEWKVLELLQREAAVLQQLDHPSIPRYVEYLEVDVPGGGPCFYLVQQLAPGKTLARCIAEGWQPDEGEVRRLGLQLLRIVQHLAALSPPIIHRDIKPQNVMRRDDGRLYLVDFGAVRDRYRSAEEGSTVVGTFGYMAPEQFRGHATPATDVYGVAATLVFLLTRQSPAELPQRGGKPDLRGRMSVSKSFGAWLERALDPNLDRRFASPSVALEALRLADESPTPPRTRAMLIGAILVAVAAGAGALALNRRARLAAAATAASGSVAAPTGASVKPTSVKELEAGATLAGHWSAVFAVAFTPDGASLVTGSNDHTAKLWDLATSATMRSFPGHGGRIGDVAVTPDGRQAITASDGVLEVWDLATGQLVRTLSGHSGQVTSTAVAGVSVASGGFDRTVRLWALDDGRAGQVITTPSRVLTVALTPDARLVAAGGDDRIIRVWETASGKLVHTLTGHRGPVDRVLIAPDGQTLISTSDDHSVRVWVLSAGKLVETLEAHTDEVWSAAIAPDGKTLATGAKDGTLHVWDIFSGRLLASARTGAPGVLDLAFSPDGQRIAAGLGNNIARLYSIAAPSWRPPPIASPMPPAERAPLPPAAREEEKLYADAKAILDAGGGNKEADPRAARALLERALQINPSYALARAGLGRLEYKLGYIGGKDYRADALVRAHAEFDRAIALEPNLVEALVGKGWTFRFQKDTANARGMAERAEKILPDAPDVHLLLADLEKSANNATEVLRHARAVIESTKDRGDLARAYDTLTWVYRHRKEWDAADQTFASLVNLRPDSAWDKGNYAEYMVQRGDFDRAIAMAESALAQMNYGAGRRTLAKAHAGKALAVLASRGDAQEASRIAAIAVTKDPTCAEAHYAAGMCHRARAESAHDSSALADARRELERALALDPGHAGARTALDGLPHP